ncbi:hypothetical protein [Actinacidiphila soli]|uniref:hypothetical protein n=1 Tax=Actinacidiphila soli TaxID=2487275 RepID=UPI000FCA7FD0|nr:hypothetical protein [Actinacidiphila soli]
MRTTLTPGFSALFFLLLGVAMTFVATAVPPALDFCERLRSRWRRAGRSTGRTPQRGRSAPARDALPGTPW